MSRTRDIAAFLSATEAANTDNNALLNTTSEVGLDSAEVGAIASASALTVYDSIGALPTTSLTAGDQAFITSSSRLYLSNGSGWYNVALINATPTLSISPSGTIELSSEGTATVVTLTATDSDNADANLTLSVDSGGDFFKMATLSQDSSVFTITPRSSDSATTLGFDGSSTLTFKASDGISFGSATTTFTLSFIIANSQFTTLLVKADTAGTDNQADASSSSHSITESGNVTSSAFTPYHSGGYSAYFDGTGDYLTIESPYSDVGSSADFTGEAWIYIDAGYTQTNPLVFSSNSSGLNFGLISSSGYKLYVGHSYVGNVVSGTTTINLATWYHIAVVRNNGTLKTYINGVEESSLANTSNFIGTTNYIGSIPALGSSYNWKGYLKDVRFVKGTAVYTSAFTPPTEPLTAIANTSLLTCHLPYIADGSTNGHTITVSGNTLTARFSPYDISQGKYTKSDHGGSVYFDGTDDYITVADSTDFDFGTGDFTMEGWYYATDVSGDRYILSFSTSSDNGHFGVNHYNGGWRVGLFNGSLITGTTGVQTNIWHHFAWVRASGVMKFYIDGAQVGSDVSYSSALDCSGTFRIGTYAVDATYGEYLGYLSDIRIVKGTAVYTSAFTPPTAPLTAISGTSLLTCTNKNDIWDAALGARMAKAGNTTASNTQRKFDTSSAMYFDGSGDEITTPASDLYNYGTGDFTWEAWVYVSSQGTYDYIFGQHTLAAGLGLYIQGGVWKLYGGNAVQITTTTSVSNGTWYHVALARESGTARLFVDGTLAGNATITSSIPSGATYGITLGRWTEPSDAQYFHGYLQDVRVTNGLARYTSTFTPSTEEFKG